MAIYHFSVKVISRASGASALASAAYRSASRLHDQRFDRHHDFTNKAGVIHSEVMLPDIAPAQFSDREQLWNAVESAELRKDAQLAREIEFALPRELNQTEGIRLAREFVRSEFVTRGMIADLNVHWDVGADGSPKPHAHVMLTMREVDDDGFGQKVRGWNRTELLQHWREAWGEHVNRRLAELDIDWAVDHRSLHDQGIDLEPQHKIGAAAGRRLGHGLEAERLEEHCDIARRNGARILANPSIALDAITHQQSTFTSRDLARFVHRHSDGKDQFDQVLGAVRASPELIELGWDRKGETRFTSRDMLNTELRLERQTRALDARRGHGGSAQDQQRAAAAIARSGLTLSVEQKAALQHVTRANDLAVVAGYAGTGKSAMLGVAREVWESAGYTVRGAALSGIAAENLEAGSGIQSRTIASLEHQWAQGRELLDARDVFVIDEAEMIGTRQMERVMAEAGKRQAKVVLVGDPEQLQAIEAGAAFRSIAERHGCVEITDIRRQREDWQRDATKQLASRGRTGAALDAYRDHGMVHESVTREHARTALAERWDRDRKAEPGASRIILTHTRDEVRELNLLARERMLDADELGVEVKVITSRGPHMFAAGDRVMFLRNERSLGVKNGSLGRVDSVTAARMAVMLDDGRSIAFDVKDYADLDHGYAATIHKAQGMTVDKTHVLATPGMDRHAAYVALSRHRHAVDLHYGRDDFADSDALTCTLSRERTKDMAGDYQVGPKPIRRALAWHERPELGQAVARHGRITSAILCARSVGDPPTAAQSAELNASRDALDTINPEGSYDLEAAYAADRSLVGETRDGQTQRAIRAMKLEAEMRVDPRLRADVFVQRWQNLERQRRSLLSGYEPSRASMVADTMAGMAKGLERDPQVESLLRQRKVELGIGGRERGGSIGHDLAEMVGLGRGRGVGR